MTDRNPELGPLASGPESLPVRLPSGIAGLVAYVDARLNLDTDIEVLTGEVQVRTPSVLQQTAEVLSLMFPIRR